MLRLAWDVGNQDSLARGQHHGEPPPLQLGVLLHLRQLVEIGFDALEEAVSQILMPHLPSPEPQGDLGLVPVPEKAPEIPELRLIVALFGSPVET